MGFFDRNHSGEDWCSGPLMGKIIRYAIPIICTGLLQLFFNAADLVVVGRFRGNSSLAAVGNTGALTNLIINFFLGISVGAGVSAAHALGAGKDDEVHQVVHTAIPTAFLGGLFLTLVGVAFTPAFLRWMGTPEDVLPKSVIYMRVYFCGMVGNMLYNYGASLLRAAGDTRSPLRFLSIAGVLNVILNVIFVVCFGMDVEGVALATALTQALSAVLTLRALTKRTDACRLELRRIKVYKAPLLKMLRIGLPAGFQASMFSISNVLIQSSINSFGSEVMSGSAAAGNLEGFVYVCHNAFSEAALNFTGRNVGAGKYKRIPKILGCCLAAGSVVATAAGGLVYIFGRQLLSIYITDSEIAITYGLSRLLLVVVPYAICSWMNVASSVLRGMGHSFVPMVISVMGICVFRIIWLKTVFAAHRTFQVLFLSYPVSWILVFAIDSLLLAVIYRKTLKRQNGALTVAPRQ